jgi:tetratricopeptide (TPR) repeat protein
LRLRGRLTALFAGLALLLPLGGTLLAETQVDSGAIRLAGPSPDAETPAPETPPELEGRRGFDYDSFEQRLESLWFQRKAYLADGREGDARKQARQLEAFCTEEDVRGLGNLAGALVSEARRYLEEGSYEKALASLDLAEVFDPGRPQVHFGRAAILWKSGEGYGEALGQFAVGVKQSLVESWSNLTLANHYAVVAVIALLGLVALFACLMALKYNIPFRHEVGEWFVRLDAETWAPAAGWALFLLPFLTWYLAGWFAFYWIVITFRFMRRAERLTAVVLLVASALIIPSFRISVALFGMMTDPAVRTTLESAEGGYGPDRVVRLKELVDSHPDDPVYRFLLAGLYKDGRYFEEAYKQYVSTLEVDPSRHQAHINIGNVFFRLGQFPEAIAAYRRALDLKPDSVLAYYNMYIAQSESFFFEEAEESLRMAQTLDPELASDLLRAAGDEAGRSMVVDATIHVGSVWRAALEGRPLRATIEGESQNASFRQLPWQFLNGLSIAALAAFLGATVLLIAGGREAPARRCIRCGRPFCHLCRGGKEGKEYCSQCLHLFVIGDGLAPETKTRKLYEVEKFERSSRRGRWSLSLILPGAAHLLRGRAAIGCALIFLWVAAIIAWKPVVIRPLEQLTGLQLGLDLLGSGSVPATFDLDPSGILALFVAIVVWVTGNVWRWRRREA